MPKAMKARITVILMPTMTLLKLADSLMPITSRTVMKNTINIAGTLITFPV
jgi:hypothetical protein